MDYGTLVKEIGRGKIPPLLLLHGSEPFLVGDALDQLTRVLFPDPSAAALNRELFDARDTTTETVVRAALTLPFLAPTRLVALTRAQVLSAKGHEPLAAYAKAPNPSTCLLLLADEPLRADHWLTKTLPPTAVVEARRMSGAALVSWLKNRATTNGMELTDDAARLLVQWVGEDLAALVSELEKAALYASPTAQRVDLPEVRAVVGEHRLRTILDLLRALERRELGDALTMLERLLGAGEEPLAILGTVTRELRYTWLAKEWSRRGRSAEEVARLLHRPQHAAESILALAAALSSEALARRLTWCWEAERRLKSGGLPRPEMAALLVDLCVAG